MQPKLGFIELSATHANYAQILLAMAALSDSSSAKRMPLYIQDALF